MDASPLAVVLDNPLLTKHLRSQLRARDVVPGLTIAAILGTSVVGLAQALGGFNAALSALISLQMFTLVFLGAGRVGSATGRARDSGILDFHRVAPTPPLWNVVGILLGAPAREWLGAAALVPFGAYCIAQGSARPWAFAQVELALALVALSVQAVALANGLFGKRGGASWVRALFGIFALLYLLPASGAGIYTVSGLLLTDEAPRLKFFGVGLPWLAFGLLNQLPVLGFVLVAAERKMRSERAHALSKHEAAAALLTVAVLLLGGLWGVVDLPYATPAVVYLLVLTGCGLALPMTPDAPEFLKGLRRAARDGRRWPRPWDDLAGNRPALAVLCLIVLVGATLAWEAIEGRPAPGAAAGPLGARAYSQSIVIGVMTVASFGLALQYFRLRTPRRAATWLGLFLFLAWGVPLVAGTIAFASDARPEVGQALLALSPMAGLAISTGLDGQVVISDVVRFAALVPPLGFAFIFNGLVGNAQRRLHRSLNTSARAKSTEPEFAGAA